MASVQRQYVRRQYEDCVSVRVSILEQLHKFSKTDDWKIAFQNFRASRRGQCIVRIQVGSNVFTSEKMPVSDVSYRNLKHIIDRFRFGELNTYDETIHITYITFTIL